MSLRRRGPGKGAVSWGSITGNSSAETKPKGTLLPGSESTGGSGRNGDGEKLGELPGMKFRGSDNRLAGKTADWVHLRGQGR